MSPTLTEKAVVGRRITLTRYSDLQLPDPPARPGVITGVAEDMASAWIRLDGTRYTQATRTDYPGLAYLDEVVPVPALPMGRFTPERSDENGFWEYGGVLLATLGEDGEDLVILTGDRDKARAAAASYGAVIGLDLDYVDYDGLQPYWAVFTWEPENAESPWTVNWGVVEGDEKAVRIHYLPA